MYIHKGVYTKGVYAQGGQQLELKIYVCMHVNTYAYILQHGQPHMDIYIIIHIHIYIHIYIYIYIYIYINIYISGEGVRWVFMPKHNGAMKDSAVLVLVCFYYKWQFQQSCTNSSCNQPVRCTLLWTDEKNE